MRAWYKETYGVDMNLDDVFDLEDPMKKLFKRLRKEFPNELW